jgi:CHAT domain-containing protein
MAANLAALRQRFDAEGQRLLDQWKGTAGRLAALINSGPQGTDAAEHHKRIRELENTREAIEDELSRHNKGFFDGLRPVALASIQAALPAGVSLIEYAVYRRLNPAARLHAEEFGPPRYAAFVLRRDRDIHAADLGDAAEIDALVARFRAAARDPKQRGVARHARALGERLFGPLRGALDDILHVLISPDGALNLIPFAALRDAQGRYLVERYTITYLTSGRDVLRYAASGQRSTGGPPLIIADPLFDLPEPVRMARPAPSAAPPRRSITTGRDLANVYFAPLAGASREARAIAALFPGSVVLTGPQATKASLEKHAAPRILHVATHGFFLDDAAAGKRSEDRGAATEAQTDNPLVRSGLALAGANARSADGVLTALEASALDLRGTKLVTLSACDTGLGDVKNGEGVYGFRRALVLAGAETLVMSLWPVSDQVTRELMTAYYTRLGNSEGRAEALRQVQLGMLKRADRRHPFFWASFIQSGEWASLDGKR